MRRGVFSLYITIFAGKIDVKPLITHRFNMEEVVKAFETSMEGSGIKVMINCSEQ